MLAAMSVDVSIIVVTWNARDLVDRCLAAATGAGSAGVATEVLVVDNDSSDDTVAHVRAAWPGVRVVETGRNGGMAAGNNAGMLAADGRAFLLLNSDCFLDEGAVRTMLDRLDRGEEEDEGGPLGVVVPRLRNEDGSLQRSVRGWPTPWRLFTEFFFVRRLFPRASWANAFYGAGHDYDRPGLVEWATGACLMVSREVVDDVGLMDESFFMYGEEVDWLARMDAEGSGWAVAYEPAAGAVHLGGGSAGRAWGRMFALQCANHVTFQARNGGEVHTEAGDGWPDASSRRAARRARRIVAAGLRLRIALSYVGLARGGASSSPATRRAVLREALATVRVVDPANIPPRAIPRWHADRAAHPLQRPESPAR